MFIDVTYNFTTITGQIIAVWANNSQPNTEVGRKVIDGIIVPKQGAFRADNLQSAVYQFRYYESADGVSLDALLMPPDYVKAGQTDFAVAIYHYIPDRGETGGVPGNGDYWADPVSDTDTITDERLAGATVNDVEVQIRGIESLAPYEFEMLPGGGIRLLNEQTFMSGNPANIKHFKKVERTDGGGSTTAGETFRPITESGFSAEMYGKHNFAAFGGIATIPFPAFNDIPAGTRLKFSTYNLLNGSQLVLQFGAGDSIPFAGENRNRIVLGSCEEISIYFYLDGAIIKGLAFDGGSCARGYARAGQIFNGTFQLLNTLIASPDAPLLNQADYPRLMDTIPAAMRVPLGANAGQWGFVQVKRLYNIDHYYQPFLQKFGFDDVAGTFRLPVIDDIYLKFGTNTAQADRFSPGVGSLQWGDVLRHDHEVPGRASGDNGGGSLVDGTNNGQGTRVLTEKAGVGKNNVDNFLNLPLIGI